MPKKSQNLVLVLPGCSCSCPSAPSDAWVAYELVSEKKIIKKLVQFLALVSLFALLLLFTVHYWLTILLVVAFTRGEGAATLATLAALSLDSGPTAFLK